MLSKVIVVISLLSFHVTFMLDRILKKTNIINICTPREMCLLIKKKILHGFDDDCITLYV